MPYSLMARNAVLSLSSFYQKTPVSALFNKKWNYLRIVMITKLLGKNSWEVMLRILCKEGGERLYTA